MHDKKGQTGASRDKNLTFEPLDHCFIRIPTLPIEILSAGIDGAEMVKRNPLLHEAAFIASTSLVEALPRLQDSPMKKARQLHSSALRYGIRMSTRTTPFGLFAGVAQMAIGARTDLSLRHASEHRHRTRFDMGWLLDYIQTLEDDPKIRQHLAYTYQPSLVQIGGHYYFEHYDTEGILTNTSIAATSGVKSLLQSARGNMKYADLFQKMLANVPEATPEEMTTFLDKFISYGILYSSLRPPLTCADPSQYLVEQLNRIPVTRTASRKLRNLQNKIAQYDAQAPGTGEVALRNLADEVNRLHPASSGHVPFDIDLTVTFAKTPSVQHSLASDAARLAELLLQCSDQDLTMTRLAAYRRAFVAKYGHHRLMPVLEVLDRNKGIGLPAHYGGSLRRQHGVRSTAQHSDRDTLLLKLALKAICERQPILQLSDVMVRQLTNRQFEQARLPQSLDIAVQIAASSQEQVNAGNYLLVNSPVTGAQPAGRIAGRFADMLGSETVDYLQSLVVRQAIQDPNRLYAELVYIPRRGHAANVAIRPPLQPYEITVGTSSGVASDQTIPLDDIYIGIRDGRLYLWSAMHQREVIVQAGHMLNMVHAPSVCRLLIDISKDMEFCLTAFSWGTATRLPMLPRVQYGRLVLSPATWVLDSQELLGASVAGTHASRDWPGLAIWREKIGAWRKDWFVPRFVYAGGGDNRLLLDLENEAHVMELLYASKSHGKFHEIRLQEALPGPEDAWITGPDGHYLNECIFQLVRRSSQQAAGRERFSQRPAVRQQVIPDAERLRLPGNGWLYFKLYMPAWQQNECLASYVEPLARTAVASYGANSWFFIRYTDPDPHIRLRFKAGETAPLRILLPMVIAWAKRLQRIGMLQRFSIDSYGREIERYGGLAAIASAEAIFAVESNADVQLIQLRENGGLGGLTLSDIAVLSTSILLSAFGLDEAQQAMWARGRASHREFVQEYRKDRQRILPLVHAYRTSKAPQDGVLKICRRLEDDLRPLGQKYRVLEANRELTIPLQEILASFVHMHCNRLLGTDRLDERRNTVYLERILSDLPRWQHGLAGKTSH